MVSLKEAYKIVENKIEPCYRITGASDFGKFYGFYKTDRRWNGDRTPGNIPYGGWVVDTVDKNDGKVGICYPGTELTLEEVANEKSLDIEKCIDNKEDLEFYRKFIKPYKSL